jgi:hypothetical protein
MLLEVNSLDSLLEEKYRGHDESFGFRCRSYMILIVIDVDLVRFENILNI